MVAFVSGENAREVEAKNSHPLARLTTPLKHQILLHQTHPLAFQLRREPCVVQQHARFDVSILAALGEIGTGYERPFPIDRNTLRVQAAPGWPAP